MQSDDYECNAPISVPYNEVIDCLVFASMFTRLNTMHTLAKYAECPRQMHWTAIKRIFCYLKETVDYGLLYEKCACAPVPARYCDWNCEGDIDAGKART